MHSLAERCGDEYLFIRRSRFRLAESANLPFSFGVKGGPGRQGWYTRSLQYPAHLVPSCVIFILPWASSISQRCEYQRTSEISRWFCGVKSSLVSNHVYGASSTRVDLYMQSILGVLAMPNASRDVSQVRSYLHFLISSSNSRRRSHVVNTIFYKSSFPPLALLLHYRNKAIVNCFLAAKYCITRLSLAIALQYVNCDGRRLRIICRESVSGNRSEI